MTVTSGTYRPAAAHQPRGGRPWCANCHTDQHLAAGSVTVLDAREQTLAVAVTCTRCGGSRVLETTKAFAAALATSGETPVGPAEPSPRPFHCKEPMALVERATTDSSFSGAGDRPDGGPQPRLLRCRCGFQMDAPGCSLG